MEKILLPEKYHDSIVQFLSNLTGPIRVADLAERMNVPPEERSSFEQVVEELARTERVVWGEGRQIALPALGNRITGIFRLTSRGFGFIVPDEPNAHGDLFIPPGQNMDAITGDYVVARVIIQEKFGDRDPRKAVSGRIIEILKRATNKCVGTLVQDHGRWLVLPDGNVFKAPIEVGDITAKGATEGDKVVVELIRFPGADVVAQGVITEVLGPHGEPEVELQSVVRQFDLPGPFPEAVLNQARQLASQYDPKDYPGREDLSAETIATIDPDDARDFDDAISLRVIPHGSERHGEEGGGTIYELGVHIADVSAFVTTQSPLDMEGRLRGNSTYFPRYVIPMLPEILSNGICSLQEKQPRLTKSAFIRYDSRGKVLGTRFANTIINSAKRLTYKQAQAIIDDAKGEGEVYTKGLLEVAGNPNVPQVEPRVRDLLVNMDRLARAIQQRRLETGMIVLDLPEVELVMDETGRVIDARPEDDSFTHKIIEMFMVEANEAVARFLTKQGLAVLRRVHPDPDVIVAEQVRQFVQAAGRKMPKVLDRKAIQQLIDSVRGTPVAYAVHLAVLKTFSTAEYSPLELGHYALASDNYSHFTSPIRRYADLVTHRALNAVLTKKAGGGVGAKKPHRKTKLLEAEEASGTPGERKGMGLMPDVLTDTPDFGSLVQLGKHLSYTERRSQDAERELRAVKILQLLAEHVGDVIDGVVTGVTGFGLFIQSTRFLVDGMIRTSDLPDDSWQLDDRTGVLRGQRTGRRIAMGDRVKVQIVSVHIAARQLDFRMLEHGSSIGGETTMRRIQAPAVGLGLVADEGGEEGTPAKRNKNLAKRQARKDARQQNAATQKQHGLNRGRPDGRGGGGGGGGGRGRGKKNRGPGKGGGGGGGGRGRGRRGR